MSMTSPFPGLDPWLEEFWSDVHTRFMVYACDQIDDQLPSDLQARVEESLGIDFEVGTRRARPDIKVVERPGNFQSEQSPADVATLVAEPIYVPLADDPEIERFIEIVDARAGQVVTVIELVSPGNKSSEERRIEYRRRNRQFLEGGVNLVEIDLIRAGSHVLAVPEGKIPRRLAGQPLICVRRATQLGAELYGASLREPLPGIRIPLRPTDRDVILQLQSVFETIYRKGRYDSIDYREPPNPRLSADDERWADELLRAKGLRGD